MRCTQEGRLLCPRARPGLRVARPGSMALGTLPRQRAKEGIVADQPPAVSSSLDPQPSREVGREWR